MEQIVQSDNKMDLDQTGAKEEEENRTKEKQDKSFLKK